MKFLKVTFIFLFLTSCIGNFTSTVFGVGVNINLDPRSPGLYLDDKLAETLIMKKIIQNNYKQIFLNVKVIDGTAILSGRVETLLSSHKIISDFFKIFKARMVMSAKLPIGVETK